MRRIPSPLFFVVAFNHACLTSGEAGTAARRSSGLERREGAVGSTGDGSESQMPLDVR